MFTKVTNERICHYSLGNEGYGYGMYVMGLYLLGAFVAVQLLYNKGDDGYEDGRVQGESTQNIEGKKEGKEVEASEDILLREFFQNDSDIDDEAEKIECLEDIDELFDDLDDEALDTEVEEGKIVEVEIEKSKVDITYEGCDGLNVPYNFIQYDAIPEFSNEGMTDSVDSAEDISKPDDSAQFKIDTETETTHPMPSMSSEEPVMYRDTDGVQYLKPRIKYFNTLPRCEMNGQSTKPLINRSKFGLAYVIAKLISKEGGSGDYQKLKPQKGKRVKIADPSTDVNTGEARVEDIENKIIVRFYDAMNLINFSKKVQRTLRKNEIMFTKEWTEQGLSVRECWRYATSIECMQEASYQRIGRARHED
ncbi:hypothetical protein L1987_70942 [Smallanthus sonchifolius]|uniref:Uncharacterized protein n=1 Tax=Smallanthus sonchifolius TaxID=185202 RepID=A0ACB9AQA1_9ASTR|nr:hypothetical protein L1987_70942 [Smallanthus sonchifolius]